MFQISEVQEAPAFNGRRSFLALRARHSDVKMTMRYTHIGLQDQAKGIQNLPTDPRWLETRGLTESKSQHISSSSQHISSKSCVCEGQAGTPDGSECHSTGEKEDHASADDASPYDTQRQKMAPPVTDGALMEAAGIEPGCFQSQMA